MTKQAPIVDDRWALARQYLASGAACCPECGEVHHEAGNDHLVRGAWSLRPRCRSCHAPLVMPWIGGAPR